MADVSSIPEDFRRRLAQREAELAILNSVQQGLASHLDIQAIYELVGDKLGEIFSGREITLSLYDRGEDRMQFPYVLESGQRHYPEGMTPGPIGRRVITESISLIFHTVQEFNDIGAVLLPGTANSLSGIFAPLRSKDGVFGILSVESVKEENAFTDSDLRLLETLANSASVALQNARLLDETRQHNAELAIINNVQEGLARQLDLRSIVNLVGEKIGGIFAADTVSVCLYDADTDSAFDIFYMDRGRLIPIPEGPLTRPGLMATMIDTRRPLLMGAAEEGIKLGAVRIAGESGEDQNESYLGVPIMLEDRTIGAVSVQSYQKNAYDDGDVQLLQTLASSMSVALQNARLLEETRRRNAELSIINNVQQGLARKIDLRSIIKLVGDKLGEIFRADSVSVGLYNEEDDTRSNVYYQDRGQLIDLPPGPLNRPSLTALMIDTREPLLLGTAQEGIDLGSVRIARNGEEDHNESFLGVPILLDGHAIGGASVQSYQQHAYDEADLRLLQTLANSMSVALHNARLFDEIQKRNDEISEALERETATSEILRVMADSPADIQPVLEAVGRNAARLCEASDVQIYRVDGSLLRQMSHYGRSPALQNGETLPLSPGLVTGRAVLERRTIHIEDAAELIAEEYPESLSLQKRLKHRSIIATPLLREGNAIGAIVVRRNEVKPFSGKQISLLATFADQAGIAIENVRLFNETIRLLKETEERNAELAIINSVQDGLASNLNMPAIYELVGNKVRDIFDAQSVLIGIFDHESRTRTIPYNWEKGGRYDYPEDLPYNRLTEILIATREPVIFDEYTPEIGAEYGLVITPGTSDAMKSGVYVPLVAGGRVFGVISLQNMDRPRAFSSGDVRLLQTLANSMSVALENARLFDETQRLLKETEEHNAELAIINSVQEGLASNLNMRAIYELVGDKVREIFHADTTYIATYHPEEQVTISQYYVEKGHHYTFPPFPMGQGLYTPVIRSRQPLLIGTSREQAEHGAIVIPSPGSSEDLNETFLGVPILLGSEVKGIISIQNYRQNAYDEGDVQLLQTLANSMSAALENARLLDETQRRASELATVNTVSTALAGELELQSLIELIGEKVRSAFNADIAYVAMLDEQTNLINFPYIHGEHLDPMQYGQGLTSKVIQSGKPLLINQEMERQRAELGATPIGRRARSYLGVPILIGGKAIGVISVQNTERENVFTEDDQRLLGTIAANVGVALQNARLFDEIRTRNRMITESLEQQTATSDVLKVMAASPTNVQPVLDAIAEHARKLCNGVFSAVYLTDGAMIDEVARSNFQPEAIEESRKWYPAPLSRDTSLSSRTVLDRAVLHLTDMRDYSDLPPLTQSTASKLNMRSVLFVPMLREGEGIGSIGVGRTHSEPFTEKQIALLQTFASQAVIAIENVRLFDEVTRRKEHFEALFASNPVAVVTVDNEAIVTSWNPSAEKLFGYTPDEALGRNVDDLVAKTPELHKQAEEYSRKGLDIRGDPFQVIVKRTRKDGSLVDVELSAVPIVVQSRKVGMFALYHDITELQRARQDAIDANEAKSAFLATMSHEIRTPMNAVIGMSSLLMDTQLSKEQREYAETIRSSGDALLAIINDILDFSKIEAGRMELEQQPFDLRECVESALDLVAGRAVEKNIELAYIFEEGVPAGVSGDVTRLRQVLLNLLSNAVKFTGQGEVVLTVSTASHVRGLPALQDGDALYFSVRDTGIGIPRSRMNRLFESFSQADSSTTRRYGGTGLGLAISKRLAEMMGGSMWASSAGEGAGSTFSFSILAPPAAIEPRKSERVSAGLQPALEGKRVLIVDDNATNRRILMLQTEKWGMHPHASEFPREALKRLKTGETFDLAILDLQMPDMDGLMLTREIRKLKSGKSLPIILLTSLGRREVETGELQFAAFLSKPLKPSSLLDALAGIFAPRRAAPAPAPAILDPSRAQRLPLRILLAEDNAVNQKLALRLLEQMGYRADVASNGLEAVECLQRQPYDLVLMDVQMPEMDGLEATRVIRKLKSLPQPRIAAMTANALQGDREMCIAAGMDDYISKPIRIPELVEVLNNTGPVKAARNGRPARKKAAAPREKTTTPKEKKPRSAGSKTSKTR